MKLFRSFTKQQDSGRVATLGVFDGVHKGHAKLIKLLQRQALKWELPSSVITFDDHPHGTLSPAERPPRIATPHQCLQRLADLNVDEVYLIKFTQNLANTTAEVFMKTILMNRLNVKHIVIGEDFVFGKGGNTNVIALKKMAKENGMSVTVVHPLTDGNRIISSSGIRQAVANGEVDKASRWLGWPYALHGIVERGEGRGSVIGIPTANLRTTHEIVPKPGTYAVLAHLHGKDWGALCHIGNRPTFHKWGPETIETYIPGWKGRLYGKALEIKFLKRLRGERHFANAEKLVEQIIKDWKSAQQQWPRAIVTEVGDLRLLIESVKQHIEAL